MLKRQRPATPPPSSLGGSLSFLPNGPEFRPLQALHTVDPSRPRSKRQRTQPPPLDGALRGWLESEFTGPHWESDGEEDWIEDPHTASGSPSLPPSTGVSQYKDTNSLLHELHVLNQHRLLFARCQLLNPSLRVSLPTVHTHAQDPTVGHRPAPWTDGSPCHPALPQLPLGCLAGRDNSVGSAEEKGFVGEGQWVRQRYEGTNRLLGSLFLSRRREVEGMTPSADPGPSR